MSRCPEILLRKDWCSLMEAVTVCTPVGVLWWKLSRCVLRLMFSDGSCHGVYSGWCSLMEAVAVCGLVGVLWWKLSRCVLRLVFSDGSCHGVYSGWCYLMEAVTVCTPVLWAGQSHPRLHCTLISHPLLLHVHVCTSHLYNDFVTIKDEYKTNCHSCSIVTISYNTHHILQISDAMPFLKNVWNLFLFEKS